MLNLASTTDDTWISRALSAVDEILLDHAHCEKKAASTSLSLLFRYPQHHFLLRPLSELAREELRHFELVLGVLDRRGIPFAKQKPSPYAAALLAFVSTHEPQRLVDTLLCCSLIEARSCERMQLLAENLPDQELADLYRSLLTSEARHHRIYVQLAQNLQPASQVEERLKTIAAHEAQAIRTPTSLIRMHS